MCLTLCQEGKKKKDINITRAVIMLWKRQHEKGVETGVADGGKMGSSPLICFWHRRSESSCGAPQC